MKDGSGTAIIDLSVTSLPSRKFPVCSPIYLKTQRFALGIFVLVIYISLDQMQDTHPSCLFTRATDQMIE